MPSSLIFRAILQRAIDRIQTSSSSSPRREHYDRPPMEIIELVEPPSLARRRFSDSYAAGVADRRRGSLLTLEHPSILEPSSITEVAQEGAESVAKQKQDRRVSVLSRQASSMSRFFALSTTSHSFIEERVLPTKIISMMFLDDPRPNAGALRETLGERLLDIPRFRCIVRGGAKGSVMFEPLPRCDINLDEHIVHIDGEGEFGPNEIEELINDAYLSRWHADLPLWRMTIVTDLSDGRSLIFAAIDHAIGDGVGLLSVLLSLLDDSLPTDVDGSDTTNNPILQTKRRVPRGLSLSHRAVAFFGGMYTGIVHCLSPPSSDPHHMLMIPKDALSEPCQGKDFAQTRAFLLAEVKSMKNKLSGATVNDVMVGLIARAISKYLEAKGDGALDRVRNGRGSLRAGFPVNMRRGKNSGKEEDLGNNVAVGYIPLPVERTDPIECIWEAKTRLDELKLSPAFWLSKRITDAVFPVAPAAHLAAKMVDIYNRCTCTISNVIGPSEAASIAGYSVNDLSFTAAHPGNLYLGILTFHGRLRVSAILDRKTEGNVEELLDCLEDAYDELWEALQDVDEDVPLERPDVTPRSARLLELLVIVWMMLALYLLFVGTRFLELIVCFAMVALPMLVVTKLGRQR